MRYLVTGAGMLGSALSERLRAEGHEVIVFDVRGGQGILEGDVADPDAIAKAVEGMDGVFHTASIHGWREEKPQEFLRTNVIGMWNLCEAMASAGVKKLVHSSTVGVYNNGGRVVIDENTPVSGEITDVYDLSKRMQESICKHFGAKSGMEYVCLRYGGFRQIIEQRYGKFTKAWYDSGAVVDLDDVVTANVRAMERLPLPREGYVVIPSGGTDTSGYQVDSAWTEKDLDFTFQYTNEKLRGMAS